MPRAARELEAARQEASFLRRHMENVKLGVLKHQSQTSNSLCLVELPSDESWDGNISLILNWNNTSLLLSLNPSVNNGIPQGSIFISELLIK